jgi:hypothetical protein
MWSIEPGKVLISIALIEEHAALPCSETLNLQPVAYSSKLASCHT